MRVSEGIKTVENPYPYAPPWNSMTTWKAAKWNLDYLIRLYRPELDRAVNFARKIQFRLESIFPLMDDLCAVTCPWCPDPCCLAAKVWVDFKDLLFLHLSYCQIPPVQLLNDLKKKCRYSSPKGCTLPRISRPWACTWYLCPTQMANLRKRPLAMQNMFSHAVQAIKNGRKEMEAEFIRVVSPP